MIETRECTTAFTVRFGDQIGAGLEARVTQAYGVWERPNRVPRHWPFVYKELHDSSRTADDLARYQTAKQAGLPVPTTYRPYDDGILATDLTRSGEQLVLSTSGEARDVTPPFQQPFKDLVMDPDSLIAEELASYADTATDAGLYLGWKDCFFLCLSQQGEANFVLGDFGQASIGTPTEHGSYLFRLDHPRAKQEAIILTPSQLAAANSEAMEGMRQRFVDWQEQL